MKRSRAVVPSVVAVLTVGAALVGSAPAAAALVLKSGGQVAPVGTPVRGTLQSGPCWEIESTGRLTINNSSVDTARFTNTVVELGTCEGGPIITGTVRADRLT